MRGRRQVFFSGAIIPDRLYPVAVEHKAHRVPMPKARPSDKSMIQFLNSYVTEDQHFLAIFSGVEAFYESVCGFNSGNVFGAGAAEFPVIGHALR